MGSIWYVENGVLQIQQHASSVSRTNDSLALASDALVFAWFERNPFSLRDYSLRPILASYKPVLIRILALSTLKGQSSALPILFQCLFSCYLVKTFSRGVSCLRPPSQHPCFSGPLLTLSALWKPPFKPIIRDFPFLDPCQQSSLFDRYVLSDVLLNWWPFPLNRLSLHLTTTRLYYTQGLQFLPKVV